MQLAEGFEASPDKPLLRREKRFLPNVGGRKRLVVAYTLASQQEFGDEDLLHMSVAFDMSSVGGRRTGCGVVGNTQNMAMLTAPQEAPPPPQCAHMCW